MNQKRDDHLTQDQLMMAMVDTRKLPDPVHAHLESCPRCKSRADEIQKRFENLGRMARRLSPEPSRIVRLKDYRGKHRLSRKWRIIPAVGVAVAAVLMLMTVWSPRFFNDRQQTAQQNQWVEAVDDRTFMADVEQLVENPLPKDYRDLIQGEPAMGDDFMNFIVPPMADEPALS